MATTITTIHSIEARPGVFATDLAPRYFYTPDPPQLPMNVGLSRGTTDANISLPSQPSPLTNVVPDSFRANAGLLIRSGLSRETIARIFRLSDKPDGWREPGSKRLDASSLRAFLTFWTTIARQAREPFLSLAPNGNLIAHWHASWRRHLDLEFDRSNVIYFGLFDNRDVLQGKAVLANLVQTLTARRNNPFMWKRA